MSARNYMLALLAQQRSGHSLAQPFYGDPDIFRLDMEQIWYREWLFAIPACELAKPGSYVTHKVGDYRVIIVRTVRLVKRSVSLSTIHRQLLRHFSLKTSTMPLMPPRVMSSMWKMLRIWLRV